MEQREKWERKAWELIYSKMEFKHPLTNLGANEKGANCLTVASNPY